MTPTQSLPPLQGSSQSYDTPPKPEESVAYMSPDQTDVRMTPQSQTADAEKAGWEPAIKMYNAASKADTTQRWVPKSQTEAATTASAEKKVEAQKATAPVQKK